MLTLSSCINLNQIVRPGFGNGPGNFRAWGKFSTLVPGAQPGTQAETRIFDFSIRKPARKKPALCRALRETHRILFKKNPFKYTLSEILQHQVAIKSYVSKDRINSIVFYVDASEWQSVKFENISHVKNYFCIKQLTFVKIYF